MKPHLSFAHRLWREKLSPFDLVIDATCGNGHDTAKLVQFTGGIVYSLDIQPEALNNAKLKLSESLSPEQFSNIKFILGSHSVFPTEIKSQSVQLIVYNLGYLPGGDKSRTTQWETTLTSIAAALHLIKPGGLICITCYPGHAAGQVEQEKLMEFVSEIDRHQWVCSHHQWINRKASPNIILIEKM